MQHKRLCAGCNVHKTFTRVINGHVCCSSGVCKERVMKMEEGSTPAPERTR